MPIDGQDIVNALIDAKRRGADSAKLTDVYGLLMGNPPRDDLLADHVTQIKQILSGTYKEEKYITAMVKDWIEQTTGSFHVSDCCRDLSITSPRTKEAVRKAITRFLHDGMIEKVGEKNGMYVLSIHDEGEEMDYQNADLDNHLIFDWPLGIQLKTRIFPKSVVIIAGVTGTGKTTYIYDWIFHNQDKFTIRLYKSEESKESVKFKLSQYQDIPLNAWKFSLRRWRGRPDEIDPNGITIIDYLSAPPDKPYMIKEPIEKIVNRLETGICIIAIQKKPGADYGTGGVWSAHDTTLNIALEYGRLEITKNRFREADQFKGLDMRSFDVRHGHIVATSGWYGDASDNDKKERRKKEAKAPSETKDNSGSKGLYPMERSEPDYFDPDFPHEE